MTAIAQAAGHVEMIAADSSTRPEVELEGDRGAHLVAHATVFAPGAPDGDIIDAFAILAEKDGVKPLL